MRKRMARGVMAILTVVALVIPPPARACGPFFLTVIFIQTKHPDTPLRRYAAGELGILQPSYARSYLVVAYRALEGRTLNVSEQQQALALWQHRLATTWSDFTPDGTKRPPDAGQAWMQERRTIAAAQAGEPVDRYKPEEKKELNEVHFFEFENCTEQAFETATLTLRARATEFGARSEAVKDWLEAQDAVFKNCGRRDSSGAKFPNEAAATLPEKIRADREYQMAAAAFYAGRWNEAQARFQKIAEDKNSPWSKTAALVAVRCRIREATIDMNQDGSRGQLLAADARLETLEKLPDMVEFAPAIRRLRGFIEFRTDPDGRALQLARALAAGTSPATLREDLDDYTKLLDRAAGEENDSSAEPPPTPDESGARLAGLAKLRQHDELTDWVFTFQATDEAAAAHAYERWQSTQSAPWLLAAVSKSQNDAAKREALLAAAAQLSPDSVAYPTVAFRRAWLLAHDGKTDDARSQLDQLLDHQAIALPVSSRNFALALRMKLARSFDEFLKYAPRLSSAITYDMNGYEFPDPPEECGYGTPEELAACRERLAPKVLLDSDAARTFTEALPVEYWLRAAESSTLSARQRGEIAAGAWVRSVLLDDDIHGKRAAALLTKFAPGLKAALENYSHAAAPEERRYEAALLLLHRPELNPEVRAGNGREDRPGHIDPYGNNWWCAPGSSGNDDDHATRYYRFYTPWTPPLAEIYGNKAWQPAFLTGDDLKTQERETGKLAALGAGPDWLSIQTIEFAKAHPDDPRAPEALHLAVHATRHGCSDNVTGTYSRQAFQLLHQKYPNSEWAKKTPYWFK